MSIQRPVVLLPTYNEVNTLKKVVESTLRAATVDILVIDDHSPDGTGDLANTLATEYVQMEADLSHPPSLIPALLELSQKYDLVLGSRWVEGGGTQNWSPFRQFISRAGSLYARKLLGIPIRDATGGFKCIRREVLEKLALEALESAGYVFQIELTYRALEAGFSVVETPIIFTERKLGASKMSASIVLEAILRVPMLRLSQTP